ncbi:MAG: hypothetical protein AAB263_07065 [Planctomycetota bacterium]
MNRIVLILLLSYTSLISVESKVILPIKIGGCELHAVMRHDKYLEFTYTDDKKDKKDRLVDGIITLEHYWSSEDSEKHDRLTWNAIFEKNKDIKEFTRPDGARTFYKLSRENYGTKEKPNYIDSLWIGVRVESERGVYVLYLSKTDEAATGLTPQDLAKTIEWLVSITKVRRYDELRNIPYFKDAPGKNSTVVPNK